MGESTRSGSLGASRWLNEARVSISGWGSLIWGQPAEQRGYSADISGLHQCVLLRGAPNTHCYCWVCVWAVCDVLARNLKYSGGRGSMSLCGSTWWRPKPFVQSPNFKHFSFTDGIQTEIDFSKTDWNWHTSRVWKDARLWTLVQLVMEAYYLIRSVCL